MVEPVIACPHCHKEIKLTESLAAPLVEATRREYETRLARPRFATRSGSSPKPKEKSKSRFKPGSGSSGRS